MIIKAILQLILWVISTIISFILSLFTDFKLAQNFASYWSEFLNIHSILLPSVIPVISESLEPSS